MQERPTVCRLEDVTVPSLLEALGRPAIVVDEEHRIVAANEKYRQAFAGGERVCGRRCYEVSHHLTVPCDQVGETCPVEAARASSETSPAIHLHFSEQGQHYESVTVYPLETPGGEIRYYLEVLEDVQFAATQSKKGIELVGKSEAFGRMLGLVGRVAPTTTTALLLGESGTGKDLVARAIHRGSPRSHGPFVPLDCSGLSETLFESELFGHEKGSFTGAHERKRGLVEAANGGTLFLDEVGDIPQSLQVKLLRLIETGSFRRVGSVELRASDFRLVCATHRDLWAMVRRGDFREDLYYRISAFPIRLPPLRERVADIQVLAEDILRQLGCAGACRLTREALEELEGYGFPGNVRELRNLLERACLLAGGGPIGPEHLPELTSARPAEGFGSVPALETGEVLAIDAVETRYVRWAAARFRGSRAQLAERLGISERTLYRRLKSD
ncbi:MAG TPA: sigma 54-interacting transcriptional regulator [Thermoanaerobaculia bacterium]|nr:sigma 54-interacting transcriptional regulator [Thermoanaerobaculia bacterium]